MISTAASWSIKPLGMRKAADAELSVGVPVEKLFTRVAPVSADAVGSTSYYRMDHEIWAYGPWLQAYTNAFSVRQSPAFVRVWPQHIDIASSHTSQSYLELHPLTRYATTHVCPVPTATHPVSLLTSKATMVCEAFETTVKSNTLSFIVCPFKVSPSTAEKSDQSMLRWFVQGYTAIADL